MQNLSDNHILVILFIIVIVLCCQRLLCMFDDYVMMGNAEWALSKMYECTLHMYCSISSSCAWIHPSSIFLIYQSVDLLCFLHAEVYVLVMCFLDAGVHVFI